MKYICNGCEVSCKMENDDVMGPRFCPYGCDAGKFMARDNPCVWVSNDVMAKCNTCNIEFLERDWLRLKYVGVQETLPEDQDLEMRNCACGSTITREIP
jgi:hypothetical protein